METPPKKKKTGKQTGTKIGTRRKCEGYHVSSHRIHVTTESAGGERVVSTTQEIWEVTRVSEEEVDTTEGEGVDFLTDLLELAGCPQVNDEEGYRNYEKRGISEKRGIETTFLRITNTSNWFLTDHVLKQKVQD